MTLQHKSVIIIMGVYAVSFGILAAQYIFADTFGYTLTNFEGVPLKDNTLSIVDTESLNFALGNITTTNFTLGATADAFIAAGEVAQQLFLILTGTYVFNFLVLMGVPEILVAGMVFLYVILVAYTIITLIRGV